MLRETRGHDGATQVRSDYLSGGDVRLRDAQQEIALGLGWNGIRGIRREALDPNWAGGGPKLEQ